jgi:Zn-dependent protease
VILAEPPPSQADLHFRLLGIPVRIHPMFWLVALLFGTGRHTSPQVTLVWIAALFVSILMHELGHASIMRIYGFQPRIVLHGFGGLAVPGSGGLVTRRTGPWDDILISFAGPGAGFLLAAVLYAALRVTGFGEVALSDPLGIHVDFMPEVVAFARRFIYVGYFINGIFQVSVFWGLVNLLPVFPLDGGQIAQQVFLLTNQRDSYRQTFMLSILVAGMVGVLGLVRWGDYFLALFFGYLAFTNFRMLQSYHGRGP